MFTARADFRDYTPAKRKTFAALKSGRTKAVKRTLLEGRKEAKRLARKRTGRMRREIEIVFDTPSLGTLSEGELIAPTFYASYVEEGTAAHDIWPKEGHGFVGPTRRGQSRRDITDVGTRRVALRFYVRGKVVFARMVHHPGSRPYPFMGPAYLKMERMLPAELERRFIGLQLFWD